MKHLMARAGGLALVGSLACWTGSPSLAGDTNSTAAVGAESGPAVETGVPAAPLKEAVRLPYGVDDVLKLSRAQISESIILNYVQNSGTIYNLTAQDVIYLRNQGVSDQVVSTMLAQRQRAADVAAAQTMAQSAPAAPAQTAAPAPAPTYTDAAPPSGETAPAYAETSPAPSSVYVIPYPAASAAYYGYYAPYPYYPGPYYRGYCGPVVSVGFRYGGWGYHGGRSYYGSRYGHHR